MKRRKNQKTISEFDLLFPAYGSQYPANISTVLTWRPCCGVTMENNILVAYCGLDCAGCPIHLATLEPDSNKQGEMRRAIAKLCFEQYGMDISPEEVTDCDGCRENTGRLFSGCQRCQIRSCAISRELQSCAYCNDYACIKLQQHFKSDPDAENRLQMLRSTM